MTTKWINKDKFKTNDFDSDRENDFSIKEGFEETNPSSDKNPLVKFLLANPLKSIFDRDPIDSRNVKEPFVDAQNDDDQNNIKPLGSPIYKTKTDKKNNNAQDNKLVESILVSLFSLFITLYVSYNWYFNLTEGFTKRIQFYEKFDVINYLYFFSEYFYKIVKFFDETISIQMPRLVNYFKGNERSVYILVLLISNYAVKTIISQLSRLYKYAKTYLQTGKINLMKIIYDPKSNSVYFSLLFIFYVIEGIISSFKARLFDKNLENTNPSESFKESLTSFKIAHPISYLIFTLIRIAIVYGPTVSLASTLFFLYFNFYSLFGISYYLDFNSDPIDEANLYNGVREGSFIDMFRRIHAVINVNHVFYEEKENDGKWFQKNMEKFARLVFNSLPFLIMFFGLFRSVPSILKINSPAYKWTGIAFISAISIGLFKFMVDENPKIYMLQEWIKNNVYTAGESVSKIFEDTNEVDTNTNEVGTNTNLLNTNLLNTNLVNTNQLNTNQLNTNQLNTNLVNTNQLNTNQLNTNLVNTNKVGTNLLNTNLLNTNKVGTNLLNTNLLNTNKVGTNLLNTNKVGTNA